MRHGNLAAEPLTELVQLSRTPQVGPVTFFSLLNRYGSVRGALEHLPELARRGGRKTPLIAPSRSQAEDEIARVQALGARMVPYGHSEYPALLTELPDAPPLLVVHGNTALWQRPTVAIVGARNASAAGCQLAARFGSELGAHGVTVVSGLARGIDTHAHKGALSSGTAGIIAGGIDTVYPPENAALYAAMRECGAIVSEQPCGQMPFASSFPARNRIIAGMCQAVLVVEAALQSGSLITARLAGDYHRELLAVPGSPLDARAQGCNQLLRQGALLAETAADVLAALSTAHAFHLSENVHTFHDKLPEASEGELARVRAQVTEKLSATAVSVDELVEQCQTTAQTALTVLLELELAGRVQRSRGNLVSLTASWEEVA